LKVRPFGLVALITLGACMHVGMRREQPAFGEWRTVVQTASHAADSGDYAAADKILVDFAARHTGTPEAREATFWRALFKLDPGNKNASISEGLATLDMYLNDTSAVWYRSEATMIKRLAITTQVLQARTTSQQRDTSTVYKTRDEEIAALRDQLSKANAELDRIKKRLADPKK
jgi:hypothetical protein